MPDLDRFERTFQAGWRAAYRHARGGVASVEEVGEKLMKSLAKTLRENHGVPGLHEMAAIVAASNGSSLLDQFSALDGIVRALGGRQSKIAADVAKSLLVQQDLAKGVLGPNGAARRFSEDVCAALVEHYFFANARQHMITEGKIADHEEARQWQSEVERVNQPAIEKIAYQLVQNPDANDLRAPKGTVKKKSTSSLLKEALIPSPAGVTT